MRYREREDELAQRSTVHIERQSTAIGRAIDNNRTQVADSGMKLGIEAFVLRDSGGSEAYAPAEWDTDETLEAYLAKG